MIQSRCTFYECCQISFVSCKENGKGSQRLIRRKQLIDFAKNLRVSNDKERRLSELFQGMCQFRFTRDNRNGTDIKNITDCLLLRQDQTSFRCS